MWSRVADPQASDARVASRLDTRAFEVAYSMTLASNQIWLERAFVAVEEATMIRSERRRMLDERRALIDQRKKLLAQLAENVGRTQRYYERISITSMD